VSVQNVVREACKLFDRDSAHPSLRRHALEDKKKSKHSPDSFSITPSMQYRAIYVVQDNGINLWYWIGSHADYKVYTGSSR
jgi:hypothetical protein